MSDSSQSVANLCTKKLSVAQFGKLNIQFQNCGHLQEVPL